MPIAKLEEPSGSFCSLIGQVPELKPGWPLLRRAVFPGRGASDRSSLRQI